jgi:aminoglycoside phosphotransferase family enzyme
MTITERVRESKAFYAAAGAGDLAVAKLREVPERLNRLQGRADPKDLVAQLNQVSARASEIIDELAERGKRIVGRIDQQQATRQLRGSARTTARQARTTAGSARRTARTTGKAVGDAAKKVGD